MTKIFVSYCWDDEPHKQKVRSFTNFLREQGFDASMDVMLSQQESAIDFIKMMHKAIALYDKVIIVLSPGYKKKADEFEGGVGTEYNLIIKEIELHPQKYILVSFDELKNTVFPLAFKGRDTISLSDPGNQEQLNRLYAKLQNQQLFQFSPVAEKKPEIVTQAIQPFANDKLTASKMALSISKFVAKRGATSSSASLIKRAEFDLVMEIKNEGEIAVPEFNVLVEGPSQLSTGLNQHSDTGRVVLHEEHINQKLFKGQSRTLKPIKVQVTNYGARSIINASITVTFHHEDGQITKNYPCKDLFTFNPPYEIPLPMSLDIFAP